MFRVQLRVSGSTYLLAREEEWESGKAGSNQDKVSLNEEVNSRDVYGRCEGSKRLLGLLGRRRLVGIRCMRLLRQEH
jgi:hypothetical protein